MGDLTSDPHTQRPVEPDDWSTITHFFRQKLETLSWPEDPCAIDDKNAVKQVFLLDGCQEEVMRLCQQFEDLFEGEEESVEEYNRSTATAEVVAQLLGNLIAECITRAEQRDEDATDLIRTELQTRLEQPKGDASIFMRAMNTINRMERHAYDDVLLMSKPEHKKPAQMPLRDKLQTGHDAALNQRKHDFGLTSDEVSSYSRLKNVAKWYKQDGASLFAAFTLSDAPTKDHEHMREATDQLMCLFSKQESNPESIAHASDAARVEIMISALCSSLTEEIRNQQDGPANLVGHYEQLLEGSNEAITRLTAQHPHTPSLQIQSIDSVHALTGEINTCTIH